jgi:hypothetical protein
MNSRFIKYKSSTGEIVAKGQCPTDMLELQASDTEQVILVTEDLEQYLPNITKYYVNNGIVTERPLSTINRDGQVFSNIPTDVPVALTIEETSYDITSSYIELDIVTPGNYTVVFKHFPYLDAEFVVIV